MKLTFAFFGAVLSCLLFLSCARLDVIGNGSVQAFGALLNVIPVEPPVAPSMAPPAAGWSINAPDGRARFSWNSGEVTMTIDARPFIDAGLDMDRLDMDRLDMDRLAINRLAINRLADDVMVFTLGFPSAGGSPVSPLDDFRRFMGVGRGSIGYHKALDHYGVAIGDGNLFEWARDMGANDKDMVFVLNPDPLIQAGTDPHVVEGWVFAKVTVDDANGKPIQVDKFLKPFNLQ